MVLRSSLFHWGGNKEISPCLIAASDTSGLFVQTINHCIHNQWSLDYAHIRYGSIRVGTNSAEWKVRKPNTAHLYPPDTNYWEDTTKEKGTRRSSWVMFENGWEAGLEQVIPAEAHYARFEDPEGLLGDLIVEAARIGDSQGRDGFWEAQAVFCRVIHLMLHAEHIDKEVYRISGTPDQELNFVNQVNLILRQNLSTRLSIDQIADQLHVSPSALSHKYKREAGSSPMAAYQEFRIESAKAFLLRGQSLKVIADELGFSDEFHLSKAFKTVTGLSPRNYLKELR